MYSILKFMFVIGFYFSNDIRPGYCSPEDEIMRRRSDCSNEETTPTAPGIETIRCGICPTYFRKICAFDEKTHETYIFDNTCLMDLFNCLKAGHFIEMRYDRCIYFGNFAYVHGYKYEDQDYGDANDAKNPDFL